MHCEPLQKQLTWLLPDLEFNFFSPLFFTICILTKDSDEVMKKGYITTLMYSTLLHMGRPQTLSS